MTKRERIEDMGKLAMMLKAITEHELFEWTSSKHDFEEWVNLNHDKIEYEEPRGLYHIHMQMRWLREQIEDCYYLAEGGDD